MIQSKLTPSLNLGLVAVSVIPYLYLTQLSGVFTIVVVLIVCGTFKIPWMVNRKLGPESIPLLVGSIFVFRSFISQSYLRFFLFLLLLLFCIYLAVLSKSRHFKLREVISSEFSKSALTALFLTTLPLTLANLKLPNSAYSWILIGDGNNWFTQLRLIQSLNGERFRGLLANSPGSSLMTDLLNPVRSSNPRTSFELDMHSMLNFQIICGVLISTILVKRISNAQSNFYVRTVIIFLLTQFGVIFGMLGLNGFISFSLISLLLITLYELSKLDFHGRFIYELLLYISYAIIFFFTWPILAPLVITQYFFTRTKLVNSIRSNHLFLALIIPMLFVSVISMQKIVRKIDHGNILGIPRGGIWPEFDINFYMGALLLIYLLALAINLDYKLHVFQFCTVLILCQFLFSLYPDAKFWFPWTSYYPQKLFSAFYLFSFLVLMLDLIKKRKTILFLLVFVFSILNNFYLTLPNPIFLKTQQVVGLKSFTSTESQQALALTFVLSKVSDKTPFAFWQYFEWPSESSANAWAGLAWEKYPGNWSLKHDDLKFQTNYSGPLGNRNYHNGDPSDTTNLCRLAEILPLGSIIYTHEIKQTRSVLNDCKKQVFIVVKAG